MVTAATDGDAAKCAKPGIVLVVSRNCQALRSATVIVARVIKSSLQGLKEQADSFEDVLEFFKQVRDGDGRPDTFYLGEMDPGSSERFSAKFDQLFTIHIPKEAAEREAFIQKHRVACLDPAFVHDLHQRLFRAFASLGFDDEAWYSDSDLALVVDFGRAQRTLLEGQIAQSRSRVGLVDVSGGGKKKHIETELDAAEKLLAKLNEQIEPLEAEYESELRMLVLLLAKAEEEDGHFAS